MNAESILHDFVRRMVAANAISIRDVDNGEKPFLYSSGNYGPGYLMVKGLVTQRALMRGFIAHLAPKVLNVFPDVEYVAGNATGGMVPAWIMAEKLSELLGKDVPYFYVRNTRKIGGHGELITGDGNNPEFFVPGRRGLVLEELVNYAETTCNSAIIQREKGYDVRFAATIVSYDHVRARKLLEDTDVELIELLTVRRILDIVEEGEIFEPHLVESWRSFLKDPGQWQSSRGIQPKKQEIVTHA